MTRDPVLAARCLLAARRGEKSDRALAGALLEVEVLMRMNAFLSPPK